MVRRNYKSARKQNVELLNSNQIHGSKERAATNLDQSETEHVAPTEKPSNTDHVLKDTIAPLKTQNYSGIKQNETEKILVETSKRADVDILYQVGKENSESSASSQDEAGDVQD